MDFLLFWMCFNNVLFKVVTKIKFYKCCFIKDHLQKPFCIIWWCLVRMLPLPHRLGPMDFKIFNLERNLLLWLESWQSLDTGGFRQNYLCNFHLCKHLLFQEGSQCQLDERIDSTEHLLASSSPECGSLNSKRSGMNVFFYRLEAIWLDRVMGNVPSSIQVRQPQQQKVRNERVFLSTRSHLGR